MHSCGMGWDGPGGLLAQGSWTWQLWGLTQGSVCDVWGFLAEECCPVWHKEINGSVTWWKDGNTPWPWLCHTIGKSHNNKKNIKNNEHGIRKFPPLSRAFESEISQARGSELMCKSNDYE